MLKKALSGLGLILFTVSVILTLYWAPKPVEETHYLSEYLNMKTFTVVSAIDKCCCDITNLCTGFTSLTCIAPLSCERTLGGTCCSSPYPDICTGTSQCVAPWTTTTPTTTTSTTTSTTSTTTTLTCIYSGSGKWFINCTENCNISANYNLAGSDIKINGTGYVNITSNISKAGIISIAGISPTAKCIVTTKWGGGFKG